MPSNMWTSHQRIHQYLGNHLATYGGVSIDIDTDKLDVNLGGAPTGPTPPTRPPPATARASRSPSTRTAPPNGSPSRRRTQLIHSWQAPVGSLTWSAMHTLGRSPSTIASNPSVVPEADGGLTIFAASGSGQIVHAWQQAGFPNDWEWGKPLPALPESMRAGTDPAAVLLPIGPGRGAGHRRRRPVLVIRQRQPNTNGHWTRWQSIGGSCASSPVPFVDASRHVESVLRHHRRQGRHDQLERHVLDQVEHRWARARPTWPASRPRSSTARARPSSSPPRPRAV